jgi:AraC-like DNA-binding protein
MVKKHKDIANSIIINKLSPNVIDNLRHTKPGNYISDGIISPLGKIMPETIIAWMRKGDLSQEASCLHHRFCLIISLENTSKVKVNGVTFTLLPDEGILIFPLQSHSFPKFSTNSVRLHISFTVNQDYASLVPLKNVIFKLNKDDWNIINQFLKLYFKGTTDKSNTIYSLHFTGAEKSNVAVYWFCIFLSKLLDHSVFKTPSTPGINDSILDRVVKFIYANYKKKLTAKSIAMHLAISEPHLRREFKRQSSGMNIGAFIQKLRHYKSVELLTYSNLNMNEIAESCGYADSFAFSRAFKKQYSMSPTNYRQAYSSNFRKDN